MQDNSKDIALGMLSELANSLTVAGFRVSVAMQTSVEVGSAAHDALRQADEQCKQAIAACRGLHQFLERAELQLTKTRPIDSGTRKKPKAGSSSRAAAGRKAKKN